MNQGNGHISVLYVILLPFQWFKIISKEKDWKKKKKKSGIICYQAGDITVFLFSIKTNKYPLFILFVGYV